MSNNKKEQAAYDYLHDNKTVKGKLLNSIMKKWNRWNCEKGEMRHERNKLKEESFDKASKDE